MKELKNIDEILEEKQKIEKSARLHLSHWFVLLGSLFLTFCAWYFTKQQVEEKTLAAFDKYAEQVIALVGERMEKYEDALWSGVAAIHSQSQGIDYWEWKRFSNYLKIEERYHGINGIGVIYNVPAEKLDAYLERERELRPDYKIHPPHKRGVYLPITYIEPVSLNMKAVGLDMAHEDNRYNAAIKARDTGKAQITGPITLVQDAEKTPGFLFYVPFYQDGLGKNLIERQNNFVGLVYAPFVMKKLMAGTLESQKRQVAIRIIDDEQVLYDEKKDSNLDSPTDLIYKKVVTLNKYGREWIFDIQAKSSFYKAYENDQPKIILAGGIFIDVMLLLLFLMLARSSKRSLRFAEILTVGYQDKLEQVNNSNKELERFAFLASHDLQEPLRMVKSFTDLLQLEYSDRFDDQANYYMKTITSASLRMQMLVRDLLDYSQVNQNNADIEDVDMNECLKNILINLQELIKESNAKITFDDLPMVRSYPLRQSRLLQNLISNAIKYRHKNRAPIIHVGLEESENEWIISVSDNGIGIDKQYQDQIFILFKRLHHNNEYTGTGIGLAICQKIIDSINGRFWVESTLGEGSIFYFSIPKNNEEK